MNERTFRPPPASATEAVILGAGGLVFLALALLFSWNELRLPTEAVAVVASVVVGGFAVGLTRARVPVWAPSLLLVNLVVSSGWYALGREPLTLAAVGITFVAALVCLASERAPRLTTPASRWHRFLAWQTAAIGGLAASFGGYFFVFDASDFSLQRFLLRRVVLTGVWLLSGTVLVVKGRTLGRSELRDAGFVVGAIAFLKALTYDLTHVDGLTRILALTLMSGVLLVGARLVSRTAAEVR